MLLKMSIIYLLLCLSSISARIPQVRTNFRIWQQWTYLDFKFPSAAERQRAIEMGHFVLNASLPVDISVDYKNGSPRPRVFVTNPRLEGNRPVTLGVVGPNGIIEPYPNYDWNKNQGCNCKGFTSVFRTDIDRCNRLWVLDSGKIGEDYYCAPQILAFDLATDTLLFQYRISEASQRSSTLLLIPVADVGDTCEDTFIYLADVVGFALVVVDFKNVIDWRVEHRLFYPYPNEGDFFVQGDRFDIMDGVFVLALNPAKSGDADSLLYFHSLASVTENTVPTAALKNSSLFTPAAPIDLLSEYFERDSQSAAEAIDNNGIMYFGLMEPPRVGCWNTATEFRLENIHTVATDPENLQFLSGVQVITNALGRQEVWVMASAFNKVATGTLSSTEPNFKMSFAYVDEILRDNPKCTDTVGFRGH